MTVLKDRHGHRQYTLCASGRVQASPSGSHVSVARTDLRALAAGDRIGYTFDIAPTLAIAIVIAAAIVVAVWRWRVRLDRRRRLRTSWGQPRDRPRPMALIAEYHRVRVAQRGADTSLDDR